MTEPSSNNLNGTLGKLAGQVNVPTLLMILLMGGGNWLVTEKDGQLTRDEAQRAAHQLGDIHNALSAFESRQKEELAKLNQLSEAQVQELRNQQQLLEILRKQP